MDQTVLRIFYGEDGVPRVELPEGSDAAVMDAVDLITNQLAKGDKSGLNILFSTVVHLLARTDDNTFMADFVRNIQREVPKYRKVYAMAKKKLSSMAS